MPPAASTKSFARELEASLRLTVHLWDERLSTQEAERLVADGSRRDSGRRSRRAPTADIDALAASIILQAYLDSLRAGGT